MVTATMNFGRQHFLRRTTLPGIRPTAFGWTIIGLVLLCWLMAINYSNNLLYAVVCLWLSLLISSGLLAWLQFRRVRPAGWQYDELFASTSNRLHLSLQSQGFEGTLGLNYQTNDDSCVWLASPEKPGRQSLQPPPLLGNDVLGLWQLSVSLTPVTNVLVFARPNCHQTLDKLQQAHTETKEPEDVFGLRDYQSGDAFRHIDWNASARRGELVSKEWLGRQSTETRTLDWDSLEPLPPLQRQETLTAWIIELHSIQQPWLLRLPGKQISGAADWQHRLHCLTAIAEIKA